MEDMYSLNSMSTLPNSTPVSNSPATLSAMNVHPHVRTYSIQPQWLYANVPQHPCHDQDACDRHSIPIHSQALVSPSLALDLFGAPFSMHARIPVWSAARYTDEHEPVVGGEACLFFSRVVSEIYQYVVNAKTGWHQQPELSLSLRRCYQLNTFFSSIFSECLVILQYILLCFSGRSEYSAQSTHGLLLVCVSLFFFFSGSGLSANHSSIPRPTSRTGATAKEEKFTHLAPRSFIISLINGTSRQRLAIGSAWIGKKGMGTRSF